MTGMPPFTSGASKIILCFPLMRLSQVSNDGSAPVVGSGRGCPSSLSGVSPATPAAAVAARRPRNPRLYMRSLLVVRPCGIGDIRWWIAVWPIVLLAPKIGSWMRVDVCGDIESLAVGQRAGRIERHVATDEFSGGADARHARADVVRLGTPYRRSSWCSLAGGPVTFRARRRKDARAGHRVRGERGPLLEPVAGGRWEDIDATRQEREIGHDVPHVGAGRVACLGGGGTGGVGSSTSRYADDADNDRRGAHRAR